MGKEKDERGAEKILKMLARIVVEKRNTQI
jgi:hypothetical protein